jgi:murein DD-endopeptidase MepM/ murein hydrolase activator NlpD
MFNKRSLGFIVLTALLLVLMVLPIFASSLDDARKELRDLENQKRQMEQEKRETQTRLGQLEAELNLLNSQLTKARADLDRLNSSIRQQQQKIDAQQRLVEQKEQEIYAAELHLEQQTTHLENRLRAMYLNGAVSYLEVLFNSSGFADFISRFRFLRSIIESDTELVNEIKSTREQLAEDKVLLEKELASQVSRRKELEFARGQAVQEETRVRDMVSRQRSIETQMRTELAKIGTELKAIGEETAEVTALIKKLEEEARRNQRTPGALHWPTPGFTFISSPFGTRICPITGRWAMHTGIDIAIPRSNWPGASNYSGTPAYIVAAADGVVSLVRNTGGVGYGHYVVIDHGGGHATLYAHMHPFPLVREGDRVVAGQRIGMVGSTGSSTGPHLHFEVFVGGVRQNPLNFNYYGR